MKPSHRRYVGLAESLLHEAGLTTTVKHGRHLHLTATNPQGRCGHAVFSTTPRSDLQCQMNMARQAANRLIRELVPTAAAPATCEARI